MQVPVAVEQERIPRRSPGGTGACRDWNGAEGAESHAHGAENAGGNVTASNVENQNLILAVLRQGKPRCQR